MILRDERGFVGGFEVLPFGFLVFVAGALLLTNAWAVIDATMAASAAAREATRAYVEAPDAGAAESDALRAAMDAIDGHGRSTERATVRWETGPTWARCARNTIVVEYAVPVLTVPFVGSFGGGVITTTGRHTEVVDPYRSGLAVEGFDPEQCRA